jgi:hypothetical protein
MQAFGAENSLSCLVWPETRAGIHDSMGRSHKAHGTDMAQTMARVRELTTEGKPDSQWEPEVQTRERGQSDSTKLFPASSGWPAVRSLHAGRQHHLPLCLTVLTAQPATCISVHLFHLALLNRTATMSHPHCTLAMTQPTCVSQTKFASNKNAAGDTGHHSGAIRRPNSSRQLPRSAHNTTLPSSTAVANSRQHGTLDSITFCSPSPLLTTPVSESLGRSESYWAHGTSARTSRHPTVLQPVHTSAL